MKVPRYLPKERRWILELYSSEGDFIRTLEPTYEQKQWLEKNPVLGLDANAEFFVVRQRKIKEILAEAKGCVYLGRPQDRELYQKLRKQLKLKQ